MVFEAKITDIQTEPIMEYIECKFNSNDERDTFYKLAKNHFTPSKIGLKNGPFFSEDENVVSIGYKPDYKDTVMDFVKLHSVSSL
jgi:hypothetical protein